MKINLWGSILSKKRKLIYWVLGLFLFYTVTGFLILPPIIRAVAVKQLSSQLDRNVSIKQVKLNPFAFSTTIRGLLIQDKDGEPFVSWDEVYVRFQITSIFRKEWTFREISVIRPYARAQMNKDYTLNFSDLVQKFSTNAPAAVPEQPSKPLLVHVRHLKIVDARLSVADFTVRTPFKRIIGPLDFDLENFHTAPDNNSPYSFAGTTDAGEIFSWRGYVCLDPLRSEGQLTVDHVTLNKFAPLYQDLVQFNIRSGQFGVHADYRFELSKSNRVAAVSNAAYALRNFKLAQLGSTNDIVEVVHLAVTGASADLETHHAEVGRIAASDAKLFLLRDKSKSVNVVEIAAPKNDVNQAGVVMFLLHSITNAVTMLLHSTNEWTGIIHEVNYTNCSVHLVDYANSRPATLALDDISFTAKNISNFSESNLTAELSLHWNTNGSIKIRATASFSPLTADLHFAFDNLGLNTLDPYLESQLNLLIPDASFGLNGDFHVRTPPNELPNATFEGDTWFDNFRAVDGVTAQDLLKWGSVRVSGMEASLNPQTVSIKQISIDNACAQVVIETNKAINLLLALKPVGAVAATNVVAVVKKPAVAETNLVPDMALPQISISEIVVTNTQIKFTDRSLTPNVNMAVDQAGGTISGISTSRLHHGDIDLHALVDGVGPVQITGHVNPFSGTETNELKIFMTNMDLLPTSPYSGKYAGYRIARGNLSLDLTYHLVGRNLKSQNVITIDQFNFGDKVNSPDATHLPVRLAVAIMKDREGKIVLDVPIEGNLDDPKFRIHKVVMRAIVDILTKVATSPFSLLGAAFGGGGEELSYEEFVPGSTDLSDASKKKLDTIVKALYGRPALRLQLSGSINPADDRDALQRAAFQHELQMSQWSSLSKSEQEALKPDEMVLTPEQKAQWIVKLYDQALADGKISPAVLAAHTNLAAIAAQIKPTKRSRKQAEMLVQESQASQSPNKASKALAPAPSPLQSKLPPLTDPKEALLVAIEPISDSDLEALAINRAKAVRAYILESGKVEADRLFLEQSQTGGLRQDGSRVYLELN